MTTTTTCAPRRRTARAALAVPLAVGALLAPASAVSAADATAPVPIQVTGLDVPESVLADPLTGAYLVSNIGGDLPSAATARDGDGFVSRIAPDGHVLDRHWIGGGRDGVRLDAPKGMAISGRTLYVADIDRVWRFDRLTGHPLGAVAVPGADFLNDVAARPGGGVAVSDTAVRVTADGEFEPTGHDAVYAVAPDGAVSTLARGPGLGQPNGVAYDRSGRLLVAPLDSAEVFTPRPDGSRTRALGVPDASLDGLEVRVDGSLVVSSTTGTVYRRDADGTTTLLYRGAQPADIGLDRRRGRLLIPLIADDALLIQSSC